MQIDSEELWLRIRPIFEGFAARITDINPSLMHSIASNANDAFFLRAYLAFRKHNDGDDIAITADVIFASDQLTIAMDVCYAEGQILAVGPSSTFTLTDFKARTATAFGEWLAAFERFLRSEEVNILKAASELS